MSWAVISQPLVTRISAVAGTGKVYPFWPLFAGNSSQPRFKELFVSNGVLNTWMMRRESVRYEKSQDDDSTGVYVHRVSLTALKAMQLELASAEADFQAALDAVQKDFTEGDRSLGGAVLTMEVIEWSGISEVQFLKTLCYRAVGTFSVEVLHGV